MATIETVKYKKKNKKKQESVNVNQLKFNQHLLTNQSERLDSAIRNYIVTFFCLDQFAATYQRKARCFSDSETPGKSRVPPKTRRLVHLAMT